MKEVIKYQKETQDMMSKALGIATLDELLQWSEKEIIEEQKI